MTVERLDIAKGRAPMTFPQYISILKSRAHELDAEEGNSSCGGHPRYQSINQSERGGREGRGLHDHCDLPGRVLLVHHAQIG